MSNSNKISTNNNAGKNEKNSGNNVIKGNNNKSKNIAVLAISILILILMIIIVGVAYAKYVTQVNGTATAQVAKMICNMDVTAANPDDQTIINPYCTVTLTDFNTVNNNENITETSLNYTVSVSPKSGLETLPAYYWEDSSGRRVGSASQPLTGSFRKGVKETQTYKIVFINPGTADITAGIDFDLTAIQQGNE